MSEILIMGSKYKTLYSGVFRFPKIVWILGLVSLFADIASEMVYPIFPVYLKQLGYSALFIGFLDGTGIAIAGLCKSYFGKLSDFKIHLGGPFSNHSSGNFGIISLESQNGT